MSDIERELAQIPPDPGGWSGSPFSDCDGCGYTSDRRLTMPGGNTRSGHSNYHRNAIVLRWDLEEGIQQIGRFRYFSGREIDPTQLIFGSRPQPPPPAPTEPSAVFDSFGVRRSTRQNRAAISGI